MKGEGEKEKLLLKFQPPSLEHLFRLAAAVSLPCKLPCSAISATRHRLKRPFGASHRDGREIKDAFDKALKKKFGKARSLWWRTSLKKGLKNPILWLFTRRQVWKWVAEPKL